MTPCVSCSISEAFVGLLPPSLHHRLSTTAPISLFLPSFSDPTCSLPLLSSFSLRLSSLLHAYPVVLLPLSSHLSRAVSPLQRSVLHHSLSTPSTCFLSYEFQLKPDQTVSPTECGPFAQYFRPKTQVFGCGFADLFCICV